MKFTKEEAFENIKGKLTEKGKKLFMSERSINEQLETLMPLVANEEMELSDFVEKVYKSFETMNLNSNKDQSDFVKTWQEQNPVQTPNQTQQPTQQHSPTSAEENNRKEFEAMRKQIDELIAERDNNRKATVIADKRKALANAMKSKGIKDEQWIADYVNEISVTEDLDVEGKADSALKIYNRTNAADTGSATPNASSSSGKSPDKSLAHVTAYMKARREERESINQN